MRGGFGRFRYERPQPGLQIYSYDDAIYPPRAYRYHVQQNPASSALIGGPNTTTPTATTTSSSSSGNILAEMQATAIVLPTIDADATCGPFTRSAGGVGGVGGLGGGSMSSGISGGGRSASAAPSHVTDASGPGMVDAERRPPPRLRSFFDCFVPDENGTDVQSLMEVGRHAEPLNPFHYRELWGSAGTGAATAAAEAAVAAVKRDSPPAVKAEPRGDEEPTETPPPTAEHAVKSGATAGEEGEEAKARGVAAARAASRATQAALQHTLRAVGVPEELASMVLLAARVPPGGRLTRKQEKALRIRAQRRPAPARPIRRGAKVYMPAYALPASGDAYGVAEVDGSTAGAVATGGLVDVTAAGPRVLRLAQSAAHRQRGVFGSVGGGVAAGGGSGKGGGHSVGEAGRGERMSAALLNEFAFDDGDDDEDGGRRGGAKRSRGEDYDGMDDDDDVPLIALGRWNQRGGAGSGANGSALAGGAGGVGGGGGAAAGMGGQLDEEAEEKSEDDDDLSSGMAEDDDDDANASSDGGGDRDSFGGGDDGGDDDY